MKPTPSYPSALPQCCLVPLSTGKAIGVTEKRPAAHSGWTERATSVLALQALSSSAWQAGPIYVLSELVLAQSPVKSGENVHQWHISISNSGKRPKPTHVRKARRAFGMADAEEDNHYPGRARTFWLAVDPAHRADCECKETEATVVDEDGYRWQNPKDASECRGLRVRAHVRLSLSPSPQT